MNDEELLRLRAEARAALSADRAEIDADMLRKHENALAALGDPEIAEDTRLEALLTTRDWEDRGTVSEDHIAAWKTILAMEDEDAAALRRMTPFTEQALTYQRRG